LTLARSCRMKRPYIGAGGSSLFTDVLF